MKENSIVFREQCLPGVLSANVAYENNWWDGEGTLMIRKARCGRCHVLLVLLILVCSFVHPAFGALIPADWGEISLDCLKKAEVVAAGRIITSRELTNVAPWWGAYRRGPGLVPCEAVFRLDDLVRGPVALRGKDITIRYAGCRATGRDTVPDFVSTVANHRCLVCLVKQGTAAATYVFPTDNGAFAIIGPKPTNLEMAKTETERLAAEMVSAILTDDLSVTMLSMRYLPNLNIFNEQIRFALQDKMTDKSVDVAAMAASALIRCGDVAEIYAAAEQISQWKGNSAVIIGGALYDVKSTKAVPALVKLLQEPEISVRTGAVYALRQISSPQSVAALVAALRDSDEMVRYHATFALAYQTNRMNPQWAWGLDHFRQNPQELTTKWKQWWEEEGQAHYPSLDSVLEEYEDTKAKLEKEQVSLSPSVGIEPPVPVSDPLPSKSDESWFAKNGVFLLVGGLCIIAGLALYMLSRASQRRS